MKQKLSTQLAAGFALIVLSTVFLIGVIANHLINRQFERYVTAQRETFSKELAELDHNTAELMVDEMQKELDEKNEEIAGMTEIIKKQNDEITELKRQMSEFQEQMKMILASKE